MVCWKKKAGFIVLLLVVFFIFSTTVSAAGYEINYVYYEKGANRIIHMVNYQDALTKTWPYKTNLYTAMVEDLHVTLANYRNVWIEVKVEGESQNRTINYSKAVKDGISLSNAIADSGYLTTRPNPEVELYLDRLNTVAKRVPQPAELPIWLVDQRINYQDLVSKWVIDVKLDVNRMASAASAVYNGSDGDWQRVSDVTIKGEIARAEVTNGSKTGWWRVLLDVEDKPILYPGDVRVRYDSKWIN